ncbi:MPN domain-containing protein CG4751-like isoform X2 [Agrilus planipennis]|nr:MPN domain-containing protein CG4751-like isoform X2 [Agrilus planipennis]XP_018319493.1 MPN domain-containing protein CG4751-like isoform X2 [Agrilus planipennis]
MLLSSGVLYPGPGSMTIEYLGQRFVGDLLEDGKIQSQETGAIFASPSAWAVACKRFINPDKKSGCGWASVRYRGKKLDAYKNIYYKRKKELEQQKIERESRTINEQADKIDYQLFLTPLVTPNMSQSRIVVKHNTVANRTFTHDANTLVECIPFSNLGKIQPFLVSLSTNAVFLMDFHCHLTRSEVCGYLGGHWDVNSHTLQVTRAFPCRCSKTDKSQAAQIESEISKTMEKEQFTLVGWYHSHPFCAAAPTLRDIDSQLEYEIRMKGVSDNNYTPCIGIIISPYNFENASLESSIIAYWVIPPPENKPNEYGRPMLMSYSVAQDSILTPLVIEEMTKCVEYYNKEKDYINFKDSYRNTTYFSKLKTTLSSKFPRDQNEAAILEILGNVLSVYSNDKESPIIIPSISKNSQLFPSLSSSGVLNSNLMLNSDLARALFNSGSFPSTSSLLGFPGPFMSSSLATSSMYLPPSTFKPHDIIKPLSTSSPILSKPKIETKTTPLKIPSTNDIKTLKYGFTGDVDCFPQKSPVGMSSPAGKNENYSPDFSFSRSRSNTPKTEASNMDYSKIPKTDYSFESPKVPEFARGIDFSRTLDLSKPVDFSKLVEVPKSIDLSTSCRKEPDSKNDFSTLDLSLSNRNLNMEVMDEGPSDLSIPKGDKGE